MENGWNEFDPVTEAESNLLNELDHYALAIIKNNIETRQTLRAWDVAEMINTRKFLKLEYSPTLVQYQNLALRKQAVQAILEALEAQQEREAVELQNRYATHQEEIMRPGRQKIQLEKARQILGQKQALLEEIIVIQDGSNILAPWNADLFISKKSMQDMDLIRTNSHTPVLRDSANLIETYLPMRSRVQISWQMALAFGSIAVVAVALVLIGSQIKNSEVLVAGARQRFEIAGWATNFGAVKKEKCQIMDAAARKAEGIGQERFRNWDELMNSFALIAEEACANATRIVIQRIKTTPVKNWGVPTMLPLVLQVDTSMTEDEKHMTRMKNNHEQNIWQANELLRLIKLQHDLVGQYQQEVHAAAFDYIVAALHRPFAIASDEFVLTYTAFRLRMNIPLKYCVGNIKESQATIKRYKEWRENEHTHNLKLRVTTRDYFIARSSLPPIFPPPPPAP